MKNQVAPFAATPDPTFGRRPATAKSKKRTAAEPDKTAPQAADLRLLIEEDPISGDMIYRTVDRRTGHVVQELGREEILKLSGDEDYAAGGVIRAKA